MADKTMQLSKYITSFAAAARSAQAVMSSGTDPMTIKEYKFKVNITADSEIKSETDVGLNVWRVSIKEKLTLDYKEHMGIDVECTIVPAATLASANS
ncbi:MAG: hypothetical protein OXT67_01370 [Zetaproteobacteria bacterium]|nr:hypothetical protein [Zetaproteobacteria bacterium]